MPGVIAGGRPCSAGRRGCVLFGRGRLRGAGCAGWARGTRGEQRATRATGTPASLRLNSQARGADAMERMAAAVMMRLRRTAQHPVDDLAGKVVGLAFERRAGG